MAFGYQVLGFGSGVSAPITYVTASGGTITTVCTNYKVHIFTGDGTFCVSCAGSCAGSNTVDYLVVAGGGGGGRDGGGGGGAGGFRESPGAASGCYTVSPRGAAPAAALPVTATGYPITIGGGGVAAPSAYVKGCSGVNSVFAGSSTITSAGGGGGGSDGGGGAPTDAIRIGVPGGSGGGARGTVPTSPTVPGGTGNDPPTDPVQGMDGGASSGPCYRGSGGGGATAAGCGAPNPPTCTPHCAGGRGGAGATTCITASPEAYAGGGGGGGNSPSGGASASPCGTGGAGGPPSSPSNASAGTTNKGGGGGGSHFAGGSGVVVIRYKFQ